MATLPSGGPTETTGNGDDSADSAIDGDNAAGATASCGACGMYKDKYTTPDDINSLLMNALNKTNTASL